MKSTADKLQSSEASQKVMASQDQHELAQSNNNNTGKTIKQEVEEATEEKFEIQLAELRHMYDLQNKAITAQAIDTRQMLEEQKEIMLEEFNKEQRKLFAMFGSHLRDIKQQYKEEIKEVIRGKDPEQAQAAPPAGEHEEPDSESHLATATTTTEDSNDGQFPELEMGDFDYAISLLTPAASESVEESEPPSDHEGNTSLTNGASGTNTVPANKRQELEHENDSMNGGDLSQERPSKRIRLDSDHASGQDKVDEAAIRLEITKTLHDRVMKSENTKAFVGRVITVPSSAGEHHPAFKEAVRDAQDIWNGPDVGPDRRLRVVVATDGSEFKSHIKKHFPDYGQGAYAAAWKIPGTSPIGGDPNAASVTARAYLVDQCYGTPPTELLGLVEGVFTGLFLTLQEAKFPKVQDPYIGRPILVLILDATSVLQRIQSGPNKYANRADFKDILQDPRHPDYQNCLIHTLTEPIRQTVCKLSHVSQQYGVELEIRWSKRESTAGNRLADYACKFATKHADPDTSVVGYAEAQMCDAAKEIERLQISGNRMRNPRTRRPPTSLGHHQSLNGNY